jgi:transposase
MLRFAGIDIARRTHLVAVVDESLSVLVKPTPITEDAAGYEKLVALLGSPMGLLVVMEATGHYWRNLFAWLCARGFACAVVNPLRIRHFAKVDLRRAKTDRTDALTIARFGAQKRPEPCPRRIPSSTTCARLCISSRDSDRISQIARVSFTGC